MWIDRLVRLVLPRQHFFTLLEQISERMTAAAVFVELATASGQGRFDDISGRLKPIETEADHVCQRSIRSWIGPSSLRSTARTWPA
jgi:hypothetical protein